MKFLVIFVGMLCVCSAKPGVITHTSILPGAPIGLDGRVVDTPEVALAKAEHAAAHINEKINLGLVKSTAISSPLAFSALIPGASIDLAGRIFDTPEVTIAKAEHAAAHINEKINLANEAAKSGEILAAAPGLQIYLV